MSVCEDKAPPTDTTNIIVSGFAVTISVTSAGLSSPIIHHVDFKFLFMDGIDNISNMLSPYIYYPV